MNNKKDSNEIREMCKELEILANTLDEPKVIKAVNFAIEIIKPITQVNNKSLRTICSEMMIPLRPEKGELKSVEHAIAEDIMEKIMKEGLIKFKINPFDRHYYVGKITLVEEE